MSAFASAAFSTSAFSTSAFSFDTVVPTTAVGLTVDPFSVADAQQLFKKVAWNAPKPRDAFDGRQSWDTAQPTLAQQAQRLEATKRVRQQEKEERETALWLASMLSQLEDMDE